MLEICHTILAINAKCDPTYLHHSDPATKMPYPPPETLTDDAFKRILVHLDILLKTLPPMLPFKGLSESPFALFHDFEADPEMLEKAGCEVAVLGEDLERVFGWKAPSTGDGILPITERGPDYIGHSPNSMQGIQTTM